MLDAKYHRPWSAPYPRGTSNADEKAVQTSEALKYSCAQATRQFGIGVVAGKESGLVGAVPQIRLRAKEFLFCAASDQDIGPFGDEALHGRSSQAVGSARNDEGFVGKFQIRVVLVFDWQLLCRGAGLQT
jgi:hypothetical protein